MHYQFAKENTSIKTSILYFMQWLVIRYYDTNNRSYYLDCDGFICPEGITKFSSGVNSPDYYECKRVGKKTILKTCPMGNIYYPNKQRCESMHSPTNISERVKRSTLGYKREKRSDDLETFETMMLGRIVHIGEIVHITWCKKRWGVSWSEFLEGWYN